MIVDKALLEKLKDFGLNSYESKIWTALLSRGVSTAGELSDIANVPRSRSYDILETLEKKGFVIMKIGKPIKYIAVPPREVIERVKKRVSEESNYRHKVLDELKNSDILSELNTLHTTGVEMVEPSDLSGALKGRDNVHNQMELMISDAQESIMLMTTAAGLVRKTKALKKAFKKAKDRGVKVQIAAPITKETEDAIKELSQVAEIRDAKEVKARFMLIDEKEVIFMVMDDSQVHPTYDLAIWVNTPFFTQALSSLFALAWKEMKPLKAKA